MGCAAGCRAGRAREGGPRIRGRPARPGAALQAAQECTAPALGRNRRFRPFFHTLVTFSTSKSGAFCASERAGRKAIRPWKETGGTRTAPPHEAWVLPAVPVTGHTEGREGPGPRSASHLTRTASPASEPRLSAVSNPCHCHHPRKGRPGGRGRHPRLRQTLRRRGPQPLPTHPISAQHA